MANTETSLPTPFPCSLSLAFTFHELEIVFPFFQMSLTLFTKVSNKYIFLDFLECGSTLSVSNSYRFALVFKIPLEEHEGLY